MVDRIEINLLPAEYRVHKIRIALRREIFYPILLVVLGAVWLWLWTFSLDSKIRTLRNEIAVCDAKIRENEAIEKEINKLTADKKIISEKIMALERINVNRGKWVRLLEVLCRHLPDYTWLVSVAEKNSVPPVLTIEGRTFSFPEVATYMAKLKESVFINRVDLANIEQINEKDRLFRFRISCVTNPDAGLVTLENRGTVAH